MILSSILAMTVSAIVGSATADAKSVGFKGADTCAYAPFLIGGGSPMNVGASIIDIREIDDPESRVVGYEYIDDKGGRALQATALMSLWTVERLEFRFRVGDLTSAFKTYDGSPMNLKIVSCRRDHVMSNYVIRDLDRDMKAAFYSGLDVLPFGRRRYYLDMWARSLGTGDPGKAP